MKKRILFLPLLLLFGVIVLAVENYRSTVQLRTAAYEISAAVDSPIRIVQLTDLHGMTYGEDNEKLISLVAEQKPDLILMTGDMLDREDDGPEAVCDLIRALSPMAPVYYGYGNHEKNWEARTGQTLAPALTAAGAVVLDCAWVDVNVKGQDIRIGGYHGYYRQPGMLSGSEAQSLAEMAFCEEFENTDRYKILLSHIPTAWLDWGYLDTCPVDLVLSGHYHGGQIVLPVLGPAYAPYVGFFPEYTRGLYLGEQAVCVLSAGLGSSPGIPRVNNLPELVVVEIHPERH